MHTILCVVSSYYYGWIASDNKFHDSTNMIYVASILESIFLISIGIEFLTSYENPNVRGVQVKDVEKIATRYLKGGFLYDLIPTIPLQFIKLPGHKERLFYIVKIMRLVGSLKDARV